MGDSKKVKEGESEFASNCTGIEMGSVAWYIPCPQGKFEMMGISRSPHTSMTISSVDFPNGSS
jgi:hypothetical protein